MSLYINTLEMHFTSEMFGGSLMVCILWWSDGFDLSVVTFKQFIHFQLSRLSVESTSPGWQQTSDLRMTRVSDTNTHRTLLFKQITWQLLRIQASARTGTSHDAQLPTINAPLRLITSQGKCRIAIKKSTLGMCLSFSYSFIYLYLDGSVISGRIQLILDDILWVATLPQVRSALSFYRHIMELVHKASSITKIKRAQTLLRQVCRSLQYLYSNAIISDESADSCQHCESESFACENSSTSTTS